mgnify:CR=1 FL=1
MAIVGKYSSGKTTLMYLLDGLYDIDEGEILIDGYDINDLAYDELKDKINFAMQKKVSTVMVHYLFGNRKSIQQRYFV